MVTSLPVQDYHGYITSGSGLLTSLHFFAQNVPNFYRKVAAPKITLAICTNVLIISAGHLLYSYDVITLFVL